MTLDEPVVAATDYALSLGLAVMGARSGSAKARVLFFAAALTAAVGGTRHGFRSTIPPLPLDIAWRIGLAAFGASGWALATSVVDRRWRRWFSVKLAAYWAGLCVTGMFEYAIANYAFDVTAATLVVLSRRRGGRIFLAGTACTAVGAVLLRAPWHAGPLPPASLFHLSELAGCFLWYRSLRAGELDP